MKEKKYTQKCVIKMFSPTKGRFIYFEFPISPKEKPDLKNFQIQSKL